MNQQQPVRDCLSDEQLNDLINKEGVQDTDASRHFDSCTKCQTRFENLSDSNLLQQYQAVVQSKHFRQSVLSHPPEIGDLGPLAHLKIEAQIGAGGMGVVYRAIARRTDGRMIS